MSSSSSSSSSKSPPSSSSPSSSAYGNYVSHLECSMTGERHEKGTLYNLSRAGWPLLVRYDLERVRSEVDRDTVASRSGGFWKWREVLPVVNDSDVCTLGEIDTPMIEIPLPPLDDDNDGENADADAPGDGDGDVASSSSSSPEKSFRGKVLIKDEGRLPTGSFKARGLALAVSMASSFGVKSMAMPTNGNAGAALASYGSRMGMETFCFAPDDTPAVNIKEMALRGARVFRVNGYIHHCGALVAAGKSRRGWFDVSTLKEPYRIEGKKTMGYELAYQMGWTLPDVIFYPTGGGTGLIGMWKSFHEMKQLGWIDENCPFPKMVAVQAEVCAPIVRAWNEGTKHAREWTEESAEKDGGGDGVGTKTKTKTKTTTKTSAMGIRVPKAIGDFLILEACRESGGYAMSVSEDEIESARTQCGRRSGLLLCPEGAATLAAMKKSIANGMIGSDSTCVLFNCGSGLKYDMADGSKCLDRHGEIDWDRL